jgi:hypothetical protein
VSSIDNGAMVTSNQVDVTHYPKSTLPFDVTHYPKSGHGIAVSLQYFHTMPYDPQQHHRRSVRLKGYDYTQPGVYQKTGLKTPSF